MKEIEIEHTYEVTVVVTTLVPDEYDNIDILMAVEDFPINVTVEPLWSSDDDTDDEPSVTLVHVPAVTWKSAALEELPE